MPDLSSEQQTFELSPLDNERLSNLCGQFDEHLRQIERSTMAQISARGGIFQLNGEVSSIVLARKAILSLYKMTDRESLTPHKVNLALQQSSLEEELIDDSADGINIKTKRGWVTGRGGNQKNYLAAILNNDISFGIGPAGTGKTFLAVASAVEALQTDRVQRLILTRPAVEAGERLGFLPGDLADKVDPYLRPLYDALYEMIGFDKVAKLIERHVIEIAPLAFMRGRTLNDAFVILDEAQNTTTEQMKMFLTRIGFGSKAVVTGDLTQTDLPRHMSSGLQQSIDILSATEGISHTFFEARDVVRHPLVKRVVLAYEAFEEANEAQRAASDHPQTS